MIRKLTGVLCLLASAVTAWVAFGNAGGFHQGFDFQQLLRGTSGPWSARSGAGVLVGLPMLLGGNNNEPADDPAADSSEV